SRRTSRRRAARGICAVPLRVPEAAAARAASRNVRARSVGRARRAQAVDQAPARSAPEGVRRADPGAPRVPEVAEAPDGRTRASGSQETAPARAHHVQPAVPVPPRGPQLERALDPPPDPGPPPGA